MALHEHIASQVLIKLAVTEHTIVKLMESIYSEGLFQVAVLDFNVYFLSQFDTIVSSYLTGLGGWGNAFDPRSRNCGTSMNSPVN